MRLFDEARSNRILQDVSDHVLNVVAIAQDAFEIPRLPKSAFDPEARIMRAPLFGGCDEIAQVRCGLRSSRDDVQVVGHEAVRKKLEVFPHRALRELRQDISNEIRFREAATSVKRA